MPRISRHSKRWDITQQYSLQKAYPCLFLWCMWAWHQRLFTYLRSCLMQGAPSWLLVPCLSELPGVHCLSHHDLGQHHGRQCWAESCLLSQTDSTSAEGWLKKSSFDNNTQSANCKVAWQLATQSWSLQRLHLFAMVQGNKKCCVRFTLTWSSLTFSFSYLFTSCCFPSSAPQ